MDSYDELRERLERKRQRFQLPAAASCSEPAEADDAVVVARGATEVLVVAEDQGLPASAPADLPEHKVVMDVFVVDSFGRTYPPRIKAWFLTHVRGPGRASSCSLPSSPRHALVPLRPLRRLARVVGQGPHLLHPVDGASGGEGAGRGARVAGGGAPARACSRGRRARHALRCQPLPGRSHASL